MTKADFTMDIHRAAKYLGISERTLYRYCKKHLIAYTIVRKDRPRSRKKFEFKKSDLDLWIERGPFFLKPGWRAGRKRTRTHEDFDVDKEILSGLQAAKYLGVSKNTLYGWAAQGKIPCNVTPTGRYRFQRKVLDNWLRGREYFQMFNI